MSQSRLKQLAGMFPIVLLALLDGLVLRQGMIALGLVIYGSLRWLFPGKNGRLPASQSLAGALFAVVAMVIHFELLEQRAENTVAAAQAFHAAQGRYPTVLQELVPDYLSESPAGILYRVDSHGHRVEYYAYSPIFLEIRFNRLEQGKWESLVD